MSSDQNNYINNKIILNNLNIDSSANLINDTSNIDSSANLNIDSSKNINNYSYGSDYGSDYGSGNESDYDYENIKAIIEQINNTNNVISLSTNGFLKEDIDYKKLSYATKKQLKMCNMCGKLYTNDMIFDINDITCYHCFFWINYDLSLRDIADNTSHLIISEYILKCKDDHDITKCSRHTDKGGCFLCEYKLGIPIIDIKNAKLIYEEEQKEILVNDDNIYIDIPNATDIVIEL